MRQEKISELENAVAREHSNITGIVVQKDCEKLYEKYLNGYNSENTVHLFSVTKSIVSILIGIAIDKGLIKSLDTKVLDFFPDYTPLAGEKTIHNITVKNLMTMTAPYKYDKEPYVEFFISENPIRTALDYLGGDKPIGKFNYAGIGGTHILSGILTKAIGEPILEFAKRNLFTPLNIDVPQNVVIHDEKEHGLVMNDNNTKGWVIDPQGNNIASWGLFMTPKEMAKIGLLYLNNGVWNGQQIVSDKWIIESTAEQSRCEEFGLGYGYLWWLIDNESFAAMGDGGIIIYVNTKKQLSISIAAFFIPDAKIRIELIKNFVEPIFDD